METEEIQISLKQLEAIIATGNLYFQHPVNLESGLISIKSYKKLINILMQYDVVDSTLYDSEVREFFTYWDNDNNRPLFDIEVYKDCFSKDIKYKLSTCSLFGMYWLKGNTLSPGQENMIDFLHLDVPFNIDLLKYVKNNFRLALIEEDFQNEN